jgi:hypothetical protein
MPSAFVRSERPATLLLVGARRTWPLLRLGPSSWLRPLLVPAAKRTRHSLVRPALISVPLAAGASAGLLVVLR